jgi:hypothetical protein
MKTVANPINPLFIDRLKTGKVFISGAGIQIKVAGFNIDLWRWPILDNVSSIKEALSIRVWVSAVRH